ncbi:MAG: hypothetical protein M3R51_05550 [Candidatus Eremiobacteraeota bacterium]|nr:hypothetical protein [Candidatus Eremiobacteraeota bacterium]
MKSVFGFGALVIVAVLAQIVVPGRPVYHAGWFNVAIAALVIVVISRTNAVTKSLPDSKARAAAVAGIFGVAIAGVAGVACGLFAAEAQTVVGMPDSSVRVAALDRTLQFPSMGAAAARTPIDGALLLRAVPRSVVEMRAFDLRGGRLTITQPTGSAFLSPVLLMRDHQTIAGLNLPFDSFAVPAAHLAVKAVLFSTQEASQLRGARGKPGPAVLFDVSDESGRSVRGGLALARDGDTVRVGGVQLQPAILSYPAIEAIPIPNVFAAGLGFAAFVAGAVLATLRTPYRS